MRTPLTLLMVIFLFSCNKSSRTKKELNIVQTAVNPYWDTRRMHQSKAMVTTNWNLIKKVGLGKLHSNIDKLESVLDYSHNDNQCQDLEKAK